MAVLPCPARPPGSNWQRAANLPALKGRAGRDGRMRPGARGHEISHVGYLDGKTTRPGRGPTGETKKRRPDQDRARGELAPGEVAPRATRSPPWPRLGRSRFPPMQDTSRLIQTLLEPFAREVSRLTWSKRPDQPFSKICGYCTPAPAAAWPNKKRQSGRAGPALWGWKGIRRRQLGGDSGNGIGRPG